MSLYSFLRPLLFKISPESAHYLALLALRWGVVPRQQQVLDARLKTALWGMSFANPVGMAAGFEKNAKGISGLRQQGFGFIEVGSVTPRPQSGNPKPRLFRLIEDEAIINRMGFCNGGIDPLVEGLNTLEPYQAYPVPIGVNIGKNKDTVSHSEDYCYMLEHLYPLPTISYFTVNISSPNTPGLRQLQEPEQLDQLIGTVMQVASNLSNKHAKTIPILVKIDADGTSQQRQKMAEILLKHKVNGIIVSNTTINRPASLRNKCYSHEIGGLSGRPLFELSTQALKEIYRYTEGQIPLIGLGGIASAEDAYAKIRSGASLVQLYTALIYQGFSLVSSINKGLLSFLERDGFQSLSQAVGVDAQ